MIMTEKTNVPGQKPTPVPLRSPIKVTWPGLKSNPGHRDEISVTNRLCHSAALKDSTNLKYI